MPASAPRQKPRPLPTAAALALGEGRRIEAIKLLRESEGCDLSTAAARINDALAADPALKARLDAQLRDRRKNMIVWVVLVDAILVAGAMYWFFFKG